MKTGGNSLFPKGEKQQTNAFLLASPEITEADFNRFRSLIYERSGISLNEGKKELVRARLLKRMRKCGLRSFKDYYLQVQDDTTGMELVYLLDAISTNQTFFFREPQHFEYLAEHILPKHAGPASGRRRLHIWSAGCSSGEEPYTLAMVILEYRERFRPGWEVQITASDLSTRVLDQARQGIYPENRLGQTSPDFLKRYFQKGVNRQAGFVRVKPQVRQAVEFVRLNLMEPFPFQEGLDIIFCRNVMIYFDKPTQERLVKKFYQVLHPGGYLFIGHSESLAGVAHNFSYRQPTIYQK